MRYFKHIKGVLIPISICTLVILLMGCGKSSDGLAGREFKGIVDGKTDAIFTFKDDGTFKVVSAQGKPNAGEEFTGEYKIKKEGNTKYLILSDFSSHIFGHDIQNIKLYKENSKSLYIYGIEKDGKDFKLLCVTKKDEFDKNQDFKYVKIDAEQENNIRLISNDN
ncbi:hypothetical protein ACN9US_10635 [Staphylococcus caprae]|uniref:hypothetical protein n=1 Tax=Staphylococcus caprae TaxID=29380 RepID=UPI003B20BB84